MNGHEGYVYFFKGLGTNMVKIGKTRNSSIKRRKEIQNMSPVELRTIGLLTSADYSNIEKEMHELFAPYRVWGEWFEFPDKQLGALKRCVKTKKRYIRRRGDVHKFNYEAFKDFWRREVRKNDWV